MERATAGDDQAIAVTQMSEFAKVHDAYNALRRHKIDAEMALRESESRLRTIADNLPVLIAYIGADRRYHFCNATYETWFQRPLAELVGQPYDASKRSEDRQAAIESALGGTRAEIDEELQLPMGTRHGTASTPAIAAMAWFMGFHALTAESRSKLNESVL